MLEQDPSAHVECEAHTFHSPKDVSLSTPNIMFLTMNHSFPMTASTKPCKRDHFLKHDETVLSAAAVSSVNQMKLDDLFDTKSVYSQSMATSDTSSVNSAESTIVSVNAEPARKSALKRENATTSGRSLHQQQVRIRFNPSVQQQRHLALHEYATEELHACWFRGEEYTQIARSCCKEINMLEQQQDQDSKIMNHKYYCPRGLESHTRLAAMAKNQNRRVAWDAVLDEQGDQLSLGVVDDESIASRYCDASSSCKLWASRVGQQDQRAAELVYDIMFD